MGKGRLEAFSDGVIAVIITIMVLELKAPRGHDLEMLESLTPSSRLRRQLRARRDLLEQPSPHAPCRGAGRWKGPLDEPASSLLALTRPLRDELGRRRHLGDATPRPYAFVMLMAGVSWLLLQRAPREAKWSRLPSRSRRRPRYQGQDFCAAVRLGDRSGVREDLDRGRAHRARRDPLVRSDPRIEREPSTQRTARRMDPTDRRRRRQSRDLPADRVR